MRWLATLIHKGGSEVSGSGDAGRFSKTRNEWLPEALRDESHELGAEQPHLL
jgi:hypothetical protein